MYNDHGLLLNQRIDVHHMMAGDVNLQLRLKDAVLTAFADHGIRGLKLVETRKRGFKGKSQTLIKQLETIRQSAYRKRGENSPAVEYGILPTPIIQFSNDLVPIENRFSRQLRRIVDAVKRELEYLKHEGNSMIIDFLQEHLSRAISPNVRFNRIWLD